MKRFAWGAGAAVLAAATGTLCLVPPGGRTGEAVPAAAEPEPATKEARPPRRLLDTTYAPPPGRAHAVPAGGDLQEALDRAEPGDVITLQAGAVYEGPFRLPEKAGASYIVVRTGASDAALPSPGTRIDPSYAALLPKLQASGGPVLIAAQGAHHYRFIGLEFRPRPGAFLHNLVQFGAGERSIDRLPHHLIVDRCYLHGDPARGTRRGIALNSRDTAVIDSYLSDFKEVGADSQALAGWNGAGPFKIVNNHLEGAGENLIFGGTTPSIRNLVASDIEIRRNHFVKPPEWQEESPAYQGVPWSVKNLFELKNARRVLFEGNLLESNWAHAQRGFAIVLTVRTESDEAAWAVVEDVIIRNNIVRRTGSGVNILGIDDTSPGGKGRTRRILLANNLFEEVGGAEWGGAGAFVQILNGAADIRIEHNTVLQKGTFIAADMLPGSGLVLRDNIAPHNEYGIHGGGKGIGQPAIDFYFPDAIIEKNVLAGVPEGARYPPDNFFPESLAAVGFVDPGAGDYRLAPHSPYRGAATDGKDVGADLAALSEARTAAPSRTGSAPGSRG